MESLVDSHAKSESEDHAEGWMEFFRSNCDALFQTALLLTADPEQAEASVVAAIDSLSAAEAPKCDALASVQASVARRAIQIGSQPDGSALVEAQAMLPSGLRAVLQIEPSSRVCFVLRMLLGYATSSCAGMMGVEESTVKTLLRIATLQLHSAVMRNGLPRNTNRLSATHAAVIVT